MLTNIQKFFHKKPRKFAIFMAILVAFLGAPRETIYLIIVTSIIAVLTVLLNFLTEVVVYSKEVSMESFLQESHELWKQVREL